MGIKAPSAMRIFYLERAEDETGVSGDGRVAEGVEFSDGQCALHWLTHTSCSGIYANVKQLVLIHGHGGKTQLVWADKAMLATEPGPVCQACCGERVIIMDTDGVSLPCPECNPIIPL